MNKSIIFILFVRILLTLFQYFIYDFGFDNIVIGKDELLWQENSKIVFENLFKEDFIIKVLSLPSSYNNFGWPLLVATSYFLFGINYFNIVLLKFIFLIIATFSLKKILLYINYSHGLIILNIFFLNFYYPLAIFHNSFLRDDVLVYLIIIAIDLLLRIQKYKLNLIYIIKLLFILWVIIFSRFLAIFLIIGFIVNLKKLSKRLIYIFLIFIFIFVNFNNFAFYIFNFLQLFIIDSSFFFKILKFYYGPFPITMFYFHSEYSPYWYVLSFIIIIYYSFFKLFWMHIFKNKLFIIFTIIFIFYPYYIRSYETDSIGPRQFAMIAPFMFFLIYSKMLYPKIYKYIKINNF